MRLVCLLGREAGLACLRALIDKKTDYQILLFLTHRFLPLSESRGVWPYAQTKKERPEFLEYKYLAERNGIDFYGVDTKAEFMQKIPKLLKISPDLLVSCSWRFHVPQEALKGARLGGINLHRGRLPDYAGAEPVRRALENGDEAVTITAHAMEDKIDAGEILSALDIPVSIEQQESSREAAERIKREIVPYYPMALFAGIKKLLSGKNEKS